MLHLERCPLGRHEQQSVSAVNTANWSQLLARPILRSLTPFKDTPLRFVLMRAMIAFWLLMIAVLAGTMQKSLKELYLRSCPAASVAERGRRVSFHLQRWPDHSKHTQGGGGAFSPDLTNCGI